MKKKLTFLMFSLLLAVGWTSTASAQSPTMQAAPGAKVHSSVSKTGKVGAKVPYKYSAIKDLIEAPAKPVKAVNSSKVEYLEDTYTSAPMQRAPLRATYNETADKTLTYAEYERITYDWVDANGERHTSKLTEPATDPYQMAYLVGTTYMNPNIPGIKYTEGKQVDHPYSNIAYAYDIPANARWSLGSGSPIGNVVITFASGNADFRSITVTGNLGSTSWSFASNGTNLPTGWSTTTAFSEEDDNSNSCYIPNGGTITVPASLLNGSTFATVTINAKTYNSQYSSCAVTVAGAATETITITNYSSWSDYSWTVSNTTTQTSVTPPYDNGYTVFITKLKDGVHDDNEPEHTNTWADLISYFNTYFESIELLTDGVRVGASTATSDAGTVFTYTGNLNKFFFISKGKMYYLSSDRAPFYSMYEEFSPTTTTAGDEITDFFERMDQGEAYGVIHDCQSVNYMEHFFSMTGKDGTTHNTLSNLIFYIPDDRGQYGTRNYDHQPRVGLYTAELTATAKPNKTQEHVYDVTINWSTSLQTILGFDEPETHDLWVVVRDQQGNVVLDSLLTTTTDITYTYQVPQYPESYRIAYIVRAWPTSADEPVDHTANSDGTFYADSNPDEVTIPGYKDFISLRGDHHECDFDIDNEYNYYRNFFTLGNQNGVAGLTTAQIDAGMNTFHLFRYDHNKPDPRTEAATLTFEHVGDKVNWEVTYPTQYYYPNHTPGESKYYLTTMQIPTSGSFTVGSSGGSGSSLGDIQITFASGNADFRSITVAGNSGSTSWSYASNGTNLPTGWSTTKAFTAENDGSNSCYMSNGGTITVPASLLNGSTTATVTINAKTYNSQYSSCAVTVPGAETETITITNYSSWSNYTWTVNGTSGSGSTTAYDTTYVLVDSINFVYDCTQYTGNFTVNQGNWTSPSNSMYMTSSGAAYINYGGTTSGSAWTLYLQYTCPASLANDKLLFDFGVIDNSTYGSYIGSQENSSGYLDDLVQCSSTNRYYALETAPLGSGGNVRFYGITPSSTTSGSYTNYYSPTIYHIYVFKEVLTEVAGESVPIDVSGIQIVDQFRDKTDDESKLPYLYDYVLEYTGRNTADWDTTRVSNVNIVPVQHTSSVLNGFYTFEQMIHDSVPEAEWLPINVKNAEIDMRLTGDDEVFYYTMMRRPDTGNAWNRMTFTQKDNNNTFYTEGINYLPQYYGDVNYPGDMIERLDNAEVLTGNYNSYMRYVPVTWTYGYDRFYYDAEGLPAGLTPDGYHNSYGSPIWKTGVGDVTINALQVQRQVLNTQTNEDNPSTTWTDGDGATCNIFFVGLDADGLLPTTNMKGEDGSNYYEPYLFRVWAKSSSGALRGFTPVTTEYGDKVIDDPTADHNLQVIYEEYTNETKLNKPIPAPQDYVNARNIIKFGALNNLAANDIEIIVRFYYKVKHLDPVDDSMDNLAVLDFVDNEWNIETGNANNWQTGNNQYTAGDYTIGLANKYYYNDNIGFLMLGADGTLTLPSFNRKVKQIQVVGRPGASNTVKMNVFVGGTAVSTEVTGSTGTSVFNIDENYQEIGTNYTIKVTNNYNAQITAVIVVFEEEETNNIAATHPRANDLNPVAVRRDGSDLRIQITNNKSKN